MSSDALPNFASPPEGPLISQFCSVTAGVNCLLVSEPPCFLHSLPREKKKKIILGLLRRLVRNR